MNNQLQLKKSNIVADLGRVYYKMGVITEKMKDKTILLLLTVTCWKCVPYALIIASEAPTLIKHCVFWMTLDGPVAHPRCVSCSIQIFQRDNI